MLLAAAEMLPADSIDRIILLAPSVSWAYDLRLALRTARYGIDSFNSSQDRLVLGWGMRIVGTTERESNTAAGQYGFTPVVVSRGDAELYGKLRQHTWDPVVQWSGHDGGHSGSNQTGFLRAYVLPLLVSRCPGKAAPSLCEVSRRCARSPDHTVRPPTHQAMARFDLVRSQEPTRPVR